MCKTSRNSASVFTAWHVLKRVTVELVSTVSRISFGNNINGLDYYQPKIVIFLSTNFQFKVYMMQSLTDNIIIRHKQHTLKGKFPRTVLGLEPYKMVFLPLPHTALIRDQQQELKPKYDNYDFCAKAKTA